jgi:hypothetical protein
MTTDKRNLIVVLNDGQTFADIDGCVILEVTDKGAKSLSFNFDFNDLFEEDIIGRVNISDLIGEFRLRK